MVNPLLSIRLQTFNHVAYIKQSIESVLMQKTNFPFEIVIGDDFSTDGTSQICEEYALKYPDKINFLKRKRGDKYDSKRQKLGRLFNFTDTVSNCKGKYIALLDGDDYFCDEYKLQKQVDLLELNPNYTISYHAVKEDYIGGSVMIQEKEHKEISDITDLLKGWFMNTPSIVARNEIKKFPEWYYTIKSGDFGYQILLMSKCGGKIHYMDQFMSVYRIHEGGFAQKLRADYFQYLKDYLHTNESISAFVGNEYDFILKPKIKSTYTKLFYILRENKNKSTKQYLNLLKFFISSDRMSIQNLKRKILGK